MKLENGQQVKCVFRNGTIVEGIVKVWSKEEAILNSLDGKNMLIIPRPDEDIMLIKLALTTAVAPEKIKTELEDQFDKAVNLPSDDPNRLKTMVELKVELAETERQIVANKLKDHTIGSPKIIQYETPFGTKVSAYDLGAMARARKAKK